MEKIVIDPRTMYFNSRRMIWFHFFLWMYFCACHINAFSTSARSNIADRCFRMVSTRCFEQKDANHVSKRVPGDPLRAASGIRPSLYPVTINAIAEALKLRAKNDPKTPLRLTDGVEPLQLALAAGRIAAEAIQKRQSTSEEDGMSLTAEEQQTIAGRVVGVVMRLETLESQLVEKCKQAGWIAKYGEWDSFGILSDESDKSQVDQRIIVDPLFGLNRAECLLALFLHHVEAPQLLEKNATVPGGSDVDFLDGDRKEVLLS